MLEGRGEHGCAFWQWVHFSGGRREYQVGVQCGAAGEVKAGGIFTGELEVHDFDEDERVQ